MPSSRHKILSHVFSGICCKLNRTKRLSLDSCELETPLKRCLTTFDITLLGEKNVVIDDLIVFQSSKVFHLLRLIMVVFTFKVSGIWLELEFMY